MNVTADEIQPRTPKTPLELERVADVLRHAPQELVAWPTCWIVASTTAPLHRVYGTAPTLDAARAIILDARQTPAAGWSAEEVASLAPYGEFDTGGTPRLLRSFRPCTHDGFSEWRCTAAAPFDEVQQMTLRIVRSGYADPIDVDIPVSADLLVFDASAMEKFIYPHYEHHYGPEYVEALRARMG